MNLRSRIKKSIVLPREEHTADDTSASRHFFSELLDERANQDESAMTTTPSDSWALKELAEHIKGSGEVEVRPEKKLTGYKAVLVGALDRSLEMVGRSGREVIYGLMERRYGLYTEDIVNKPGVYVSALRDLLGSSCTVVEKNALAEIRELEGIEAHTFEEAVFRLKKKYGEA
jgi:hypothetical protein